MKLNNDTLIFDFRHLKACNNQALDFLAGWSKTLKLSEMLGQMGPVNAVEFHFPEAHCPEEDCPDADKTE